MTRLFDCIQSMSAVALICALATAHGLAADAPSVTTPASDAPPAAPSATTPPSITSAPAATGGSAPAATASVGTPPVAPRSWELSPYRIQLFLRVDSAPGWNEARRRDFAAALRTRAQALVGGIWQLTATEAPDAFPWGHATDPAGIAADSVPAAALDFDKVILLDIRPNFSETTLWAREYDVRTRLWSPPQTRSVESTAELTQESVRTIWTVFRPVARIENVASQETAQEATLRLLGGGLPSAGHGLDLARVGLVWQPLVRHTDAAGHTLPKGVYSFPWTWLQTLRVNGALAQCRVVSAVTDPIDLHYDGRTEYLALAVNARSSAGAELTVLAEGAGEHPLEDLEVMAREGEGPLRLIGQTDINGRLRITGDALTLLTVYIRSGDELLLRLPLLNGAEASATVRAEDNGRRAATARLVDDASDQLLDLAAQQQLLAARIQRQLAAGKTEEAENSLTALSGLPTSEKFASSLDAQRAGLPSSIANDSVAGAWLDKQLAPIKTAAAQNLINDATLAKLHDAVIAAHGK